jgi:hypothetical protein
MPGGVPTHQYQPKSIPLPGDVTKLDTVEDAQKALADAEKELSLVADPNKVEALSSSRCVRACKALGSMQRAVDRLCELTDDDDERCEDGRERVARSRKRVRDAGCTC